MVKGVGEVEFPEGMSPEQMRMILQQKFMPQPMGQAVSDRLNVQPTATPTELSFGDMLSQGIGNTLYDTGIVSDRYRAMDTGRTLGSIAEAAPVIGDAIGGDDLGRAIREGDALGTGIGLLSAIPVVGNAAKKGFDAITKTDPMDFSGTKLYHGSSDVIDQVDPSKLQSRDAGFLGKGFYLTESDAMARSYGDNVQEFYPTAKKTLTMDMREAMAVKNRISKNPEMAKDFNDWLRTNGYDSAAYTDKNGKVIEMVTPNAIKGDDMLYKGTNINPEYVETIGELGGLPSPSIGISKVGQPLESYGDISLVGRSDAFANDPTFAADVYSPRQQRPDIDISRKKQSKETDRLIDMVGSDYLSSDLNLGNDPFDEMYRNPAYVAEYAKSKGIDIAPERFMNETDELRDLQYLFGSDLETIGSIDELTDAQNKAARKYYTRQLIDLQERIKQPSSKIKQANLQKKIDANKDLLDILFTDGRLNDTGLDVLKGTYDKAKSQSAFRARDARDQLMNELGDDLSSYGDFINDKLQALDPKKSLFDQEYFYNTGERRSKEYNLENLTKLMTSKSVRGGEGIINPGIPTIRAQVTPKLKNLKDIQDNRGRIITSDEFSTAKLEMEEMQDGAVKLMEDADPNTPKGMDFLQELELYAKKDKTSEIYNLNSTARDYADKFLKVVEDMPTEYFEVKPQRAVDMSEFYGAAVPKGTSSKVIAQLEEKGLQIEYYDPSKGRKQAIENLNTKAGGGILFSGGGIMFLTSQEEEDDQIN